MKHKKMLLGVLGSLACFIILLAGFMVLLPYFIKLEPIREKILAVLSEQVGGEVKYQKLDLSYFPLPRVKIHQVTLSIPEKATGTLTSVQVYPQLLAFLRGKMSVNKIEIESPDVSIRLPKRREKTREKPERSLFEEIGAEIAQVSAVASTTFPNLIGVMKNGSLNVYEESELILSFSNLGGRIVFSPGKIQMAVSCRSNLWDRMSAKAAVNPVDFKGHGEVDLVNFYPHVLTDSLVPSAPLRIKNSRVNLKISFRTEGPGTLETEVEGSIPLLSFHQKNKEVTIKGKTLRGSFQMEGERVNISLTELNLDDPKLKLSGKFQIDQKEPLAVLEVQGRDVDVVSTREVVLTLTGELPITKTIFTIVRGGRVPRITFQSRGQSMADLDETENFSINGSLQEGKIFISEEVFDWKGINFDLEKVSGEIALAKGILEAKNVRARMENGEIREGQLRVGLEGEDTPFHLEVVSKVNLSYIPPLLSNLIKDEAFLKELGRTHDIKGKAVGKLVLGESTGSIEAKIEIWEMNLLARYEQIPYQLEIDRGQLYFDGNKIGLNNLSGKMGESRFSRLTVQLGLGKEPTLEALSGEFLVSLGEVYPWLASFEGLRKGLEGIKAVKGTLGFTVKSLGGPLLEPQRWRFESRGKVKSLSAKTPLFPEPIEVVAGTFKADSETLSFTEVQTNILGAPFNVSGNLTGYLKDPFRLEILTQVDFAKLLPILNRVLKDEEFKKELARVENLEGSAKGKLVLERKQESLTTRLEASDIHLSARYGPLPYPLEIGGGNISYAEGKVAVNNLNGKMGESIFSELTARLRVGKDPSLEVVSGKLAIFLDEIYPWISSQGSLRSVLKDVKSVSGTLTFSAAKLKGPVFSPEKWDFETTGELKGLVVNAAFFPEPFTVSGGKFEAYPGKLSFADFQTKLLDASLQVSGTLYDYQRGLEKAELDFSGPVTPKDIQWFSDSLGMERRFQVRSPIQISKAHLSWRKSGEITFKGILAMLNGPEISLDVSRNPQELKINNLVIHDEISHATIGLDLKGKMIGLTFSGHLSERTIDKIFSGYQFQDGWIRGDFRTNLNLEQPVRSTAQGKLEADHLSFPWQFEKPLEIEDISLDVKGNRITVVRANVAWGGKRFSLSGDVRFSDPKMLLDISLLTESVDLGELKELRPREKEAKRERDSKGLPLEGVIRFRSNSLKYGRFTWEPFRAHITVGQNGLEVNVEEAKLCGISTPAIVKVIDQELSLDVRPVFRSRELESTAKCLLNQEIRATGDFDFRGRIFTQGKPEDLIDTLRGDVELQAKDGQIYYSIALFRILEFLNVTEVYKGKLPNVRKEGLDYELVTMKGFFRGRKLIIKEVTLDGPTLEMAGQGEIDLAGGEVDLTVLVAPLKTVDRIIKSIPLVNYILAGTLVTVPVRLRGDLKDPKVTPLSPSAVGSELLGIMRRTLELPFKVIEPLRPRKKEESGEPLSGEDKQ